MAHVVHLTLYIVMHNSQNIKHTQNYFPSAVVTCLVLKVSASWAILDLFNLSVFVTNITLKTKNC